MCGQLWRNELKLISKQNQSIWGHFVILTLLSIFNKFQIEELCFFICWFNICELDFFCFVVCRLVLFPLFLWLCLLFWREFSWWPQLFYACVVVFLFELLTCLFVYCSAMCEEESIWFGAHRRLVGWYLVSFAQIISDRSHIANMPALYFVSKLNCIFIYVFIWQALLVYVRFCQMYCIYYYVFEMVLFCLQLYLICTEPCCALFLSPFLPIICILWQLVNTPSFVCLPKSQLYQNWNKLKMLLGGSSSFWLCCPSCP